MTRLISFLTLLPVLAQAHEGHGIEGASHYHATDAVGLLRRLGDRRCHVVDGSG